MADNYISVEVGELLGTAQALEQAMATVQELNGYTGALSIEEGAAGHPGVALALSEFISKWSYGLSCLNKDGNALASMLATAGGMYQETEGEIAKAAGQ